MGLELVIGGINKQWKILQCHRWTLLLTSICIGHSPFNGQITNGRKSPQKPSEVIIFLFSHIL